MEATVWTMLATTMISVSWVGRRAISFSGSPPPSPTCDLRLANCYLGEGRIIIWVLITDRGPKMIIANLYSASCSVKMQNGSLILIYHGILIRLASSIQQASGFRWHILQTPMFLSDTISRNAEPTKLAVNMIMAPRVVWPTESRSLMSSRCHKFLHILLEHKQWACGILWKNF